MTTESLSAMRPSARDFTRKIRPRGESISVPSSANVGQYARQSPQWTHWFTPSTESPCSVSGVGVAGAAVTVSSLIDLAGGLERRADAPDMAPRPPTLGRAPAQP